LYSQKNQIIKKHCYPFKKSNYEKSVVSALKKVKGNEELVLSCAKEVKMLTHLIKKRKIMIKVMRVLGGGGGRVFG
jgi:hypothetical protein